MAHILALYDAELAMLDNTLGRIFDYLRNAGLADNTVIAVVSDHGEEFGEHGMVALRECGINYAYEGTTTIEEVVRETVLEA